MTRLSHKDIQILTNCIREIYSDLNLDGWHSRLLSVISKMISSNVISYSEINPMKQEHIRFIEMPSNYIFIKDIPVFGEYMHEHPGVSLLYHEQMMRHPFKDGIEGRIRRMQSDYIRHPEGRALKISDMLTDNQFRSLGLYNEFFRKYDVEYQIGMVLSHRTDTSEGIAIGRDRRDFSERDRLMLNLLAPHIIQAHRNAEAVSAIRRNVQATADAQARAIDNLTLREAEALHWVAQGKSNAQIAIILNIAADTVKKHLMRIYQKLGVENRTAAALMAADWKVNTTAINKLP